MRTLPAILLGIVAYTIFLVASVPASFVSERIVDVVLARQPRWLLDFIHAYHGWQERLIARSRQNQLWQLSRKRIAQLGVGMLFVTGLVVFSEVTMDLLQVVNFNLVAVV